MLHDLPKDRVQIGRPVTDDQRLRFGRGRRLAEEENDFDRFVRFELDRGLKSATGIETGADPVGKEEASPVSAAGLSSVPFRPRNSRRSPVQAVCRSGQVGKRDAGAEVRVPGIAGQEGARLPARSPSR